MRATTTERRFDIDASKEPQYRRSVATVAQALAAIATIP
jgi:hypothetical protein